MFFILSKTVGFLLLPSNFLLLLALAGAVCWRRAGERAGLRLVVGAVVLLAIVGLFPVGTFLIHDLESRFPQWDASRGTPDGIIVLGKRNLAEALKRVWRTGFQRQRIAHARHGQAGPRLSKRTYRLLRRGCEFFGNGVREADFVYPALESLGVARERVQLETQSRNTAENAAFTKLLVNPKPGERWLLVTSARHMPRAVGCFRRAGFPVEAYPVGWRAADALDVEWGRGLADGLERLDFVV